MADSYNLKYHDVFLDMIIIVVFVSSFVIFNLFSSQVNVIFGSHYVFFNLFFFFKRVPKLYKLLAYQSWIFSFWEWHLRWVTLGKFCASQLLNVNFLNSVKIKYFYFLPYPNFLSAWELSFNIELKSKTERECTIYNIVFFF